MALTGLDIYKHLPKENCKECGLPTCLAFAMKVAGGQAALVDCPRLSEDAKSALGEASAPPQQLVTIGAGDAAIQIGQETVLYRHEEKFHHPAAVAITVKDDLGADAIKERCEAIAALSFDRMGKTIGIDMVAVVNASGDAAKFAEAASLAAETAKKAVALLSSNTEALLAAGKAIADARPLLWATGGEAQADAAIEAAKELSLPLCLQAPGFEPLAAVVEKARAAGLKELIMSPGETAPAEGVAFLSQSRRAAIQKKYRPMGYPVAMLAQDEDPIKAVVDACWYILKYAGILVTDQIAPEYVLPILTSRGDVYTDPQVPVQVEAGIHEIGNVGPDSPVLVTTNFALSYYSVESEVEAARFPSYILSVDTEGTSVLTAWAADKFTGQSIAAALAASGVEAKAPHKKLVLPGQVAVLSAAVEDESGWGVQVGPKEASGLSSFLKTQWKT